MRIEQTQSGNASVIAVHGIIKMSESGKEFSAHLQKILEKHDGPVLIDLSGVDEVDSNGLGELVGYLQLFAGQGRMLAVVKPTEKIRRLFEFTNLDKVLPIFDNLENALGAANRA